MTVTCPSCNARFRSPPADISRSRPMQCGKCHHQWFLEPEEGLRIKMDAPSLAPDMADVIGTPRQIQTALPVVVEARVDEAEDAPQPVYVDRAPDPASTKPVNSRRPILVLACMTALAGTLIFKDAVMAELPQTVPFYKVAGLAAQNPDLEIANVVTTKTRKDGISQLIVRGEVQNIADNTVPVPALKLTMRGESSASLYAWTVSPAKETLKAGEKSRFTAVAHDFPGEAVDVEVEFVSPVQQ